jgi:hypothetical protein
MRKETIWATFWRAPSWSGYSTSRWGWTKLPVEHVQILCRGAAVAMDMEETGGAGLAGPYQLPPTGRSSRRGRRRNRRCRARPGLVVLDAGRPAGRPDARVSRRSSPSGKSGGRRPPLGRLALGRPLPASAMLREEGRRSGFAGGDIERREEWERKGNGYGLGGGVEWGLGEVSSFCVCFQSLDRWDVDGWARSCSAGRSAWLQSTDLIGWMISSSPRLAAELM